MATGLQEKIAATQAFLSRKIVEYAILVREIERLSTEFRRLKASGQD